MYLLPVTDAMRKKLGRSSVLEENTRKSTLVVIRIIGSEEQVYDMLDIEIDTGDVGESRTWYSAK